MFVAVITHDDHDVVVSDESEWYQGGDEQENAGEYDAEGQGAEDWEDPPWDPTCVDDAWEGADEPYDPDTDYANIPWHLGEWADEDWGND